MRILHVCITSNVFSKDYAYQDNLLAKYHRLLGHEVTIVAPIYSEYEKKTGAVIYANSKTDITDDGIKIIRLSPLLNLSVNKHIHLFKRFSETLSFVNPDFIFVHGVSSLNYRSLYKYKRKHPNVIIVFDSHADFYNSCSNFMSRFYSHYIVRWLIVPKIVRLSDFFYGVTPGRCLFLNTMYGVPNDKIHLLPMGADDESMDYEKKGIIRSEVRNRYNIREDDFLIVTGGKIDLLKNIHVLAEAVSRSSYLHIKMIIFGSIRNELKVVFDSLLSNRIRYIGWLPSNEVYEYFYAADIVIFPGLHSVLWEQAVASRVPCAFSKINGFEHVDIGGNCILMDGKTVDYYQRLIEKLYTDKNLYNKLYEQAQNEKAQQFLYSRIASKVIEDTVQ